MAISIVITVAVLAVLGVPTPADATVGCGDGTIDPGNGGVCDDFNTQGRYGSNQGSEMGHGVPYACAPSWWKESPIAGQLATTDTQKWPRVDAVGCQTHDEAGQWFEVHTATSETLMLVHRSRADDGVEQTRTSSPLTIMKVATLRFGHNCDDAIDGQVVMDFAHSSRHFLLGTSSGEIGLGDSFPRHVLGRAMYRGARCCDRIRVSLSLRTSEDSAQGNDIGETWRAATLAYGEDSVGIPG